MMQCSLLNATTLSEQTLQWSGISAKFIQADDDSYEVEININNIKFFCTYKADEFEISCFEIVASQGVADLTKKLILLLKDTITYLLYKLA